MEIIWTVTPAIVLIGIALPSFKLLYLMDEVMDPSITIKAVGLIIGGLRLYRLNKDEVIKIKGKDNQNIKNNIMKKRNYSGGIKGGKC